MYYIGLSSGTSMDAIDAALVKIVGASITLEAYQSIPLPGDIKNGLLNITEQTPVHQICVLDVALGHLFADAALELIRTHDAIDPSKIIAIGSHGQTIYHRIKEQASSSMQIADPNIIALRTDLLTVADFRRMDIAAGGHGAPLVPAFHETQFRKPGTSRVILNIGGIANISVLPGDPKLPVTGFDTGPGNTLMDSWIQQQRGLPYDESGNWAATGHCQQLLLNRLLSDPYFKTSPPKSTGKELFNLSWLKLILIDFPTFSHEDIQASLLMLSAKSIADAILNYTKGRQEIFVCGGGAYNKHLMTTLQKLLPKQPIKTTDALSLAPDCVESVAFAWLAKQRLDGIPGNLPSVTGAKKNILLGSIYQAN